MRSDGGINYGSTLCYMAFGQQPNCAQLCTRGISQTRKKHGQKLGVGNVFDASSCVDKSATIVADVRSSSSALLLLSVIPRQE